MPTTTPTPDPQSTEEQDALIQELRRLAPSEDIREALRAAIAASRHFITPAMPTQSLARAADLAVALEGPLMAPYLANLQQSIRTVGAAMASTPALLSPELAMSIQATENAWRQIEDECGFASSVEVATLLGSRTGNRNVASDRRAAGKLLGVLRGNSYRYPRCQFNLSRGEVWPVIPDLISLAHENHWTDEDLLLWMFSPTAFLPEEDRPVDHLQEPGRVLAAARDAFEGTW